MSNVCLPAVAVLLTSLLYMSVLHSNCTLPTVSIHYYFHIVTVTDTEIRLHLLTVKVNLDTVEICSLNKRHASHIYALWCMLEMYCC